MYAYLFIAAAFAAVFGGPCLQEPSYDFKETKCQNGWERYEDSCYYIERNKKANMETAERHCRQLNATLFVANSNEEFKEIMNDTVESDFTWIGIYKKDALKDAAYQVPADKGVHDYKEINWLIKPYSDLINGWSGIAQCAAHWNPIADLGQFSYWYPCTFEFYYICERNSSLVTPIQYFSNL